MKAKLLIVSDAAVKAALPAAIQARTKFTEKFAELDPMISPQQTAEAIRGMIDKANSAQEIHDLTAMLAHYEGDAARIGRGRAIQLANRGLDDLREALKAVVVAAQARLELAQQDAVAAETEFFSAHGLDREATSVSRQLAEVAQTLAHFRQVLSERHPNLFPNRKAFSQIFDWFTPGQA